MNGICLKKDVTLSLKANKQIKRVVRDILNVESWTVNKYFRLNLPQLASPPLLSKYLELPEFKNKSAVDLLDIPEELKQNFPTND